MALGTLILSAEHSGGDIRQIAAPGAHGNAYNLGLINPVEGRSPLDVNFREAVNPVAIQPAVVVDIGVPDDVGAVPVVPCQYQEVTASGEVAFVLQGDNHLTLLQGLRNALPVEQALVHKESQLRGDGVKHLCVAAV